MSEAKSPVARYVGAVSGLTAIAGAGMAIATIVVGRGVVGWFTEPDPTAGFAVAIDLVVTIVVGVVLTIAGLIGLAFAAGLSLRSK